MVEKTDSLSMSVTLQLQDGVVSIPIPSAILKVLKLETNSEVELTIVSGELIIKKGRSLARKRYSADQLLEGSDCVERLNRMTAFAREGSAVGRELA